LLVIMDVSISPVSRSCRYLVRLVFGIGVSIILLKRIKSVGMIF